MMKARLAAFGVAATLASAGVAHAAAVPLRQDSQIAPAAHGTHVGAQHEMRSQKIGTDPVHAAAIAAVREEAVPPATGAVGEAPSPGSAIEPDPLLQTVRKPEPALKDGSPLHSYLLSAGQYVLQVGTLSEQYTAPSKITDVPLPGAIWLFGSALLAFLGISSRRKL
jgi:hypothetical protein